MHIMRPSVDRVCSKTKLEACKKYFIARSYMKCSNGYKPLQYIPFFQMQNLKRDFHNSVLNNLEKYEIICQVTIIHNVKNMILFHVFLKLVFIFCQTSIPFDAVKWSVLCMKHLDPVSDEGSLGSVAGQVSLT